jgi:hypothetical protein
LQKGSTQEVYVHFFVNLALTLTAKLAIKIIRLLTIATLVLITTALSSCSEQDDRIKIAPPGKIIATYPGESFESIDAVGFFDGDRFLLGGFAENNSHITLSLEDTKPGTYAIGRYPASSNNSVTLMPEDYDAEQTIGIYSSVQIDDDKLGTIIVTEFDDENHTISGTFHSRMKRSVPKEEEIEIGGSFTKISYTPAPIASSFSVQIDGNAFTPSVINAIGSFDILMISAIDVTQSVAIVVPQNTSTGTFSLEDGLAGDYRGVVTQGLLSFESVSGSVTISKHDKTTRRIEGTFSFMAEDFVSGGSPVNVSGEFSVSY